MRTGETMSGEAGYGRFAGLIRGPMVRAFSGQGKTGLLPGGYCSRPVGCRGARKPISYSAGRIFESDLSDSTRTQRIRKALW